MMWDIASSPFTTLNKNLTYVQGKKRSKTFNYRMGCGVLLNTINKKLPQHCASFSLWDSCVGKEAGCQIFLGAKYQNGKKYTK
jgi:hypothetical protein